MGLVASLIVESHRPRKPFRVDYFHRRQRRTARFATRAEAESFIGSIADGKPKPGVQRVRVKTWCLTWLKRYGAGWVARTQDERAGAIDDWIAPYIGAMYVGELRRSDILEWRLEMIEDGATNHRANRVVAILRAALTKAVEEDLAAGNPCAGLKRLREDAVQRRTPATLQEVERIRAVVPTARDRARISLMAYAGVRPGELGALVAEDVRANTIVIRASLSPEAGEKGTKTDTQRVVPLIGPVVDDLEALDDVAQVRVNHNNWTHRVFRPAREAVGSDKTPYSLRHTFASLLIAEGRLEREVARLLGHSTPALTNTTYGHLFEEAQLAPAEDMEAAVRRARHEALTWASSSRADPGSP